MSKKEQISVLLQKGTDIDEIIEQTNSTKSYIYRIQREIDESKGNNDNSTDGKNGDTDDLVEHPAGRFSVNVEKDDGNLEEKKNEQYTDYTGAVGGIKKKNTKINKDSKKKEKIEEKEKKIEDKIEDKIRGIKLWMMLKWKKLLLILTLSILLITAILLLLMKKPREPMLSQSRYPILR